jgi:prepilin peptidase CpaA
LIRETIPLLACLALCLAAAAIDARTYRIPNPLSLGGVALGLALSFGLAAAEGGAGHALTAGLGPSAAGCLLLFAVFASLSAAGAMGMGDAKLMAAVGALLGWRVGLQTLFYVLIAGGVLSLGVAVAKGRLREVLANIAAGGKALLGRGRPEGKLELHRIPYSLAIAAGVAWTVLARYLALPSLF